MDSYVIQIENLRKSYDGTVALNGLDLNIVSGQLFGLVGPDGAGKTSMLRILCGLIDADAGQCTVAGFNVRTQVSKIRRIIGYMPQRFSLYPDLTVAENLRFFADLFQVSSHAREQRLKRLLKFSRLDPFQNRRAYDLSGGMKQKLALSCALIHTPKVLFLDEPTTGVDPLSRREFWEILAELRKEGVTLLVTTPYMDEAAKCDKVAFIHKGQILAQTLPQQIATLSNLKFVELRCNALYKAVKILEKVEFVKNALPLGDRIHLSCEDIQEIKANVPELLQKHDIKVYNLAEVAPSIEDVFVELMGND